MGSRALLRKVQEMKQVLTKDEIIVKEQHLKNIYPEATSAQEVIDLARANGQLTDKTETMAIWGRLMRLFR